MTPLARLLEPRVQLWRYCTEMWLVASIPYVAILYLGDSIGAISLPLPLGFVGIPSRDTSVLDVAQLVVFAPATETFVLALLIRLISLATPRPLLIAVLAGLVFGVIHGLASAILGIGALWGFFVFTCAFLAWRTKSFWSAYLAAFVPHALTNLSLLLITWASANAA